LPRAKEDAKRPKTMTSWVIYLIQVDPTEVVQTKEGYEEAGNNDLLYHLPDIVGLQKLPSAKEDVKRPETMTNSSVHLIWLDHRSCPVQTRI
jgi:hypothetical protein